MKEYIRMVVVLTSIAAICGLLLAVVKKGTEKKIEEQILINVQGPALNSVLASSTNDLIKDRQELTLNGEKKVVFIGKKNDQVWALAFETQATGYKGDIGVMVGYDLEQNKMIGLGILTLQETPGLGARVAEPVFTDNFKNRALTENFKVKQAGGFVDGITGATISSKAVCLAVEKSVVLFPVIKEKILAKKKADQNSGQ
jgi:electron transport complex protein RnfG